MPINANIPLSFRAPEIASPLDQATKGLTLMELLRKTEEAQRQRQDDTSLRALMGQSGGDPQKAVQTLLAAGTPKSIELASKLYHLLPKPEQELFAKPKIEDFTPDSIRKYRETRNPADLVKLPPETKPETSPEIVKLYNV